MDARVRKLAHNLIAHSLKLQPGEKVLIETRGLNVSLVQALVQEAYAAGGLPFVNIKNPRVDRALIEGCSQEQLQLMYKWEEERMLAMDCYVGIRLPENSYEEMGVDFEKLELYNALYPFAKLDQKGVGKLVEMAAKMGRETRPDIHLGICGEHGGNPASVEFCQRVGLDYVSCSPYRVPIARLAAAQAAIKYPR